MMMSPLGQGLNPKIILYIATCCLSLGYLGVANARGFVPFASPTSKYSGTTAGHFHK